MDFDVPDRHKTLSLHDSELERMTMSHSGGWLRRGCKGADAASYAPGISNRDPGFIGEPEAMARWTGSGPEDRLLISEDVVNASIAKIRSSDLVLLYLELSRKAAAGVIASAVRLVENLPLTTSPVD